jgi:quercetin dioxygenase-like cupin family protein
VPIDVRRFGVGHRRPDGPPGTVGIEAQVIESSRAGVIAELAFGRHGRMTPHSNPNTTYFVVIEGGGWVGVGDERTRIQAGEASVWPANVLHSAWTDGFPMRAIVVELPEPPLALPAAVAGKARELRPGAPRRPVAKGEGKLAPRPVDTSRRGLDPEAEEGEPL